MRPSGIVVDLFAGGGGVSLGLERAGLTVDEAVNHSRPAIAVHAINHPTTRHHVRDIWEVKPRIACRDRLVRLLWASPNCTHFSQARGGKPRDSGDRALSWSVVRWARDVRPEVILCENVPEWTAWGPLDAEGQPIPARAGESFDRWVRELVSLGYVIDWRRMRACDYGAATTRDRVYLVARRDGDPIVWPGPTHGEVGGLHQLEAYAAAATAIEWDNPAPSVLEGDEHVENTLRRVARAVRKYILGGDPYVVGDRAAALIGLSFGERVTQAPRVHDIRQPLPTIVAGGIKHGLVTVTLAPIDGAARGPDRSDQVLPFLTRYYGTPTGSDVRRNPLPPAIHHDRLALVKVAGRLHRVTDVGLRRLTPRELATANGFPRSYILDAEVDGKPLTPTDQVRLIGNTVCPVMAEVLGRANVGDRRIRLAA